MNADRRKRVLIAREHLDDATNILRELRDEEAAAIKRLPAGIRRDERAAQMQGYVDGFVAVIATLRQLDLRQFLQ